jgi:hypothetical protein
VTRIAAAALGVAADEMERVKFVMKGGHVYRDEITSPAASVTR